MDITLLVVIVVAVNVAALVIGLAIAGFRASRRQWRTRNRSRRPRFERRTP